MRGHAAVTSQAGSESIAHPNARLTGPMVSDSGLLPWYERMREEVPVEQVVDAHTHIGSNDPDGYRCSREELVEFLDHVNARAIVFPMHEPDGYGDANDMVAAEAAAS